MGSRKGRGETADSLSLSSCQLAAILPRLIMVFGFVPPLSQVARRPRSPGGAMATSSLAPATPPSRRAPQ